MRDEAYWLRAGWRKLGTYLRTRPEATAAGRGLIPDQVPHGTLEMMEIERVRTEADYLEWAETLWPLYFASAQAMERFDSAEDDEACAEVVAAAADDSLVHPDVARGLEALLMRPIDRTETSGRTDRDRDPTHRPSGRAKCEGV